MNRKLLFKVQGIVCLVAVIVMGILSLFAPLNVTVRPSENTVADFTDIIEKLGDDSKAMKAWEEKLENAQKPAKQYSEEEQKKLAEKMIKILSEEAEEKAEIDKKMADYNTALSELKVLRETKSQLSSSSASGLPSEEIAKLRAELEEQIERAQEEIASMEKELNKLFSGKKVAKSVKLQKEITKTKGFTVGVSLFDLLTNIGGANNAIQLISIYKLMHQTNVTIERLNPDQEGALESAREKLAEYEKYIADQKNYKNINAAALNVTMLMAVEYNWEGMDVSQVDESLERLDSCTLKYQEIYGEEMLIDDGFSVAMVEVISTISIFFGALIYVIGVLFLLINAIIAIIGGLLRLKNPEKLYEVWVRKFGKSLFGVALLIISTIFIGGYVGSVFSATGVVILVIAIGVSVFNGVAVRTGNLGKEEKMWLNISQGAGVIGIAGALTVALLLGAGNLFPTWNAGILSLLNKGLEFTLAESLWFAGTTIFGIVGIILYTLILRKSLTAVACIGLDKKREKAARTRQNGLFAVIEVINVIVVIAMIVLGMPLSGAAVVSLITAAVLFAMNIVREKLCAKYAGNLSDEKIQELENCAIFREGVIPADVKIGENQ